MDGNFSPSASGEANVFKSEKHYHSAEPEETPKGIIRRIREAIDPSGAASVYVDAAQTVSRGLVGIAEDLKKAGTPAAYASAQAYEIYRGAQKLTSVGKAFDYAEAELGNKSFFAEPDSGFVNNFVSSAENVSDEEILALFGKILAGEMERPGSVSKRTMRILSDMEKAHAEAFLKLCGFATYIYTRKSEKGRAKQPVIALFIDENYRSYNCNEITVDELSELESLGLIDKGMMSGLIVQAKTTAAFYSSDGLVAVSNDTDQAMEAEFKGAAFLPSGIELANICGVGDSPALRHILLEELEKQGFRTSLMNDWPFNEK